MSHKYNKKATKGDHMSNKVAHINNVVNLNKTLDEPSLNNIEESIEHAKMVRTELSDDLTELSMEQLMSWMTSYGVFNNMSKTDGRDLIMIENAIQAAIYRYHGLTHPLHEVTEEVFDFSDMDDEEEGDGG